MKQSAVVFLLAFGLAFFAVSDEPAQAAEQFAMGKPKPPGPVPLPFPPFPI